MFDTFITVVGNVCTSPVHKELPNGSITEFRVVSTSRRYDKLQDAWIDGDELFIRVCCWRSLAEHVNKSVRVGDPVIVKGRLYSRRYTDKNGAPRTSYEVNALAVGHDLSRGVGQFVRQRTRVQTGDTSEFDAIVESLQESSSSQEPEPATALAG